MILLNAKFLATPLFSLFFSLTNVDSVKSALSTKVLEGTVTEWPLRSLAGIKLTEIDESDDDLSDSSDTQVQ